MQSQRVRLEREGDIAVIVIDNPPINAGSSAVREGLMEAIGTVRSDAGLQAAVLIGAGTTFMAGSDLREFGQPLAEPQLPSVIKAIEALATVGQCSVSSGCAQGNELNSFNCPARLVCCGMPGTTDSYKARPR